MYPQYNNNNNNKDFKNLYLLFRRNGEDKGKIMERELGKVAQFTSLFPWPTLCINFFKILFKKIS
jgi:hypothetical protein